MNFFVHVEWVIFFPNHLLQFLGVPIDSYTCLVDELMADKRLIWYSRFFSRGLKLTRALSS